MEIPLSADPKFLGDPARVNPEQLLVMAVSSCQLLSFLAVAARQGVDVLSYEDDAVGSMPGNASPMRITEITLAPQILVAARTDVALVEKLVQDAHAYCYIANSLSASVTVTPTVSVDHHE
ncbi:OsmC family protein [Micromonospora phytophila]|uniref:OsmC family protein n=1 Tax=Micromonospora phytophila TaxID=709888 RepID=UPI00202EE7C8|nr:OsmC family protein [Micromonospora phytophila]MCM0674514.1 OsmC family protein [Micromonospora phytophila]